MTNPRIDYGGNPLACAVGCKSWMLIANPDFLAGVYAAKQAAAPRNSKGLVAAVIRRCLRTVRGAAG
jgi:acetylornithine/succinyldiaminopimelate/putrescine aminotransferase